MTSNLMPPWRKGQSGNPGGRPKGLAALIRQETKEGKVLVDMAIRILRGEKIPNPSDRRRKPYRVKLHDVKWALRFMAEHGFGRPAQTVELRETGPSPRTLEVAHHGPCRRRIYRRCSESWNVPGRQWRPWPRQR